jgi:hypothetical protein
VVCLDTNERGRDDIWMDCRTDDREVDYFEEIGPTRQRDNSDATFHRYQADTSSTFVLEREGNENDG